MDIISFAFGGLAIIFLVCIVIIIVGLVKVRKNSTEIECFRVSIDEIYRGISNCFSEIEVEKKEIIRYVDSRIDKTIEMIKKNE